MIDNQIAKFATNLQKRVGYFRNIFTEMRKGVKVVAIITIATTFATSCNP